MIANSLKNPPATSLKKIRALQPPIGGWTPFSSIDDPGFLSTVLFLEGCPWRCGYCHNRHLWTRHTSADAAKLSEFTSHLENRLGLLDGVVISGGEPTSFNALPKLAECLRPHFRVALHSGGANPEVFANTLPLLDWVGFDFKTTWDKYAQLTRNSESGTCAKRSLASLLEAGIPYEIRTTVTSEYHSQPILRAMLDQLIALDIKTWFIQEGRRSSSERVAGLDDLLSDAFFDQLRERANESKIKISRRKADGTVEPLTTGR